MKKDYLFSILIVLFSLLIVGCTTTSNNIDFNKVWPTLEIPNEISESIELPSVVVYDKKDIYLNWESNDKNAMLNNGSISKQEEDQVVELTLTMTYDNQIAYHTFEVVIKGLHYKDYILSNIEDIQLASSIDGDIDLPTKIKDINISWESNKNSILTSTGKCYPIDVDTIVTLKGSFQYMSTTVEKDYEITVKAISIEDMFDNIVNDISFEGKYVSKVNIPVINNEKVNIKWESMNPNVINNNGVIINNALGNAKIKLNLTYGEFERSIEYDIVIAQNVKGEDMDKRHMLVDYANTYDVLAMKNVELKNDLLVLKESATTGIYNSNIYNIGSFNKLIGSWAAVSSEHATVELKIKVLIDGIWSDYLSYQPWGLGLHNGTKDQTLLNVKLADDEIILTNNKLATSYQYQVILSRDSIDDISPKLALVAVAATIPNYVYEVDTTALPDFIDYEINKLNQQAVPSIGGVICSATSTTMLLNYKGHSFLDKDNLEHRYIAQLVKDYNDNIYGNWVFNTATMGGFGEKAYVGQMYSWEELKYHLATVGPVAASIKGNTGVYTTSGHLIVVRGYRVTENGTYVICNDPNINSRFGNYDDGTPLFVYYEFPLETFMSFWRKIVYVIE